MDRNNDATLEELCDLLEQQSGTRVSRATMGRITQNLNYSVFKNTARCGEKSESVQKKRVEFWRSIRYISINNLVFIDKSGVNLAMIICTPVR